MTDVFLLSVVLYVIYKLEKQKCGLASVVVGLPLANFQSSLYCPKMLNVDVYCQYDSN